MSTACSRFTAGWLEAPYSLAVAATAWFHFAEIRDQIVDFIAGAVHIRHDGGFGGGLKDEKFEDGQAGHLSTSSCLSFIVKLCYK